jgi:hypothetical protein
MDNVLLKTADTLNNINEHALNEVYSKVSTRSVGSLFLLVVTGLMLLGALVAVQRFLTQRMHRILNPALLAASFVTFAFLLYSISAFVNARREIEIAKTESFASLHALAQAKAVAYAANADESRFLLDPLHLAEHETAFAGKVQSLLTPTDESYRTAKQHRRLKGLLGGLWGNIRVGEDDLSRAMDHFQEYLKVDEEIRRLQRSGRHADAVALCTGIEEGDSNLAFDRFDKALDATFDKNKHRFDDALNAGGARLDRFDWKAGIIAVIIGALAFLGLLPRIREYR